MNPNYLLELSLARISRKVEIKLNSKTKDLIYIKNQI